MIYDPESNIICIELAGGPIGYAREFGNFIIHLSPAGKPVILEILDASDFIGQFKKIEELDLKRIMPADFAN